VFSKLPTHKLALRFEQALITIKVVCIHEYEAPLYSGTMSFLIDWSRRVAILPSNYESIRPHHVLVLYVGAAAILSSTAVAAVQTKLLDALSQFAESCIPLIHAGIVPDVFIRFGIRVQLRDHLVKLGSDAADKELAKKMDIVKELHDMPIAIETTAANNQHYEVPARFYDLCLVSRVNSVDTAAFDEHHSHTRIQGPRKKYSSGLWPSADTTFEQSEVLMLDLYCERAQVKDGMSVVDLGCGWGSLTLHLAEKYPNAKITGVSNSHSQRDYILKTAAERGYNVDNITIVTCNVADDKGALANVKNNDLVMTVEMFEVCSSEQPNL
jgi:cyclopropane-fatty-acyl-phospholipid synthase